MSGTALLNEALSLGMEIEKLKTFTIFQNSNQNFDDAIII